MKKNYLALGLMLAAGITLTTNCAKQEAAMEQADDKLVKEAVPFDLTIASPATKTSTEDASVVSWVADDKVAVFHSVSGAESVVYSSNDAFTITADNLADNRFTGALQDGALDGEKTYDWFVFYPYNEHITTPANTTSGYTAIGSASKDTPQVQDGYNSKAHLAGQYFPLYGKVTGVAADTKPAITLKQVMSVVKVHVTNTKDAPLTVSSVAFTAPQNIVGTYYINFAGDTPNFASSGASYVSKTANLTVNGGTALQKNESADFYIAVKPFTAAVDSEIGIAVNGEVKTITISGSEVEFKPGKIKTVNYSFDADPVIYSTQFDYEAQGNSYQSADPINGTDPGGQTSWSITYGNWAGGNSAQLRVYNGTSGGFGELVSYFDCSNVTYVTYDAKVNNTSTTLTLTPYYSTDKGASWTALSSDAKVITTTETRYKFTVSPTGSLPRARIKLVVSGERPTSGNTQLTIDNLSISGFGSIIADPYIASDNITDIPAVGVTDAAATYTIHNFAGADDVTATPDGTVVTSAVANNGTVTYTVAPNYATSSRYGSITLSSANGASKEISLNQKGDSFSVSSYTVTIPKDASSATFTLNSAAFDWSAAVNENTGMNLSVSPASGSANASSQTITVFSTTAAGDDDQVLGTIVLVRNGNTDDIQKKTVTVKKASLANVLYSCGFESEEGFSATSTYNNTTAVEQGPAGKKWAVLHGTVSTSSKISGSNSLAFRRYSDNEICSSAEMKFDVEGGPTKVSFNAKAATTKGAKLLLTVQYSTDSGATWTAVDGFSAKQLTSSSAAYSFAVSGAPAKYRLRFSIDATSTKPTTSNAQMTIDDIKIVKE